MAFEDFYAVLELAQSATPSEITKAYRKLALQLHPDRNKDRDTTAEFQLLAEAYETLKDTKKRLAYDQEYAEESRHQPAAESQPPRQTDQPRPKGHRRTNATSEAYDRPRPSPRPSQSTAETSEESRHHSFNRKHTFASDFESLSDALEAQLVSMIRLIDRAFQKLYDTWHVERDTHNAIIKHLKEKIAEDSDFIDRCEQEEQEELHMPKPDMRETRKRKHRYRAKQEAEANIAKNLKAFSEEEIEWDMEQRDLERGEMKLQYDREEACLRLERVHAQKKGWAGTESQDEGANSEDYPGYRRAKQRDRAAEERYHNEQREERARQREAKEAHDATVREWVRRREEKEKARVAAEERKKDEEQAKERQRRRKEATKARADAAEAREWQRKQDKMAKDAEDLAWEQHQKEAWRREDEERGRRRQREQGFRPTPEDFSYLPPHPHHTPGSYPSSPKSTNRSSSSRSNASSLFEQFFPDTPRIFSPTPSPPPYQHNSLPHRPSTTPRRASSPVPAFPGDPIPDRYNGIARSFPDTPRPTYTPPHREHYSYESDCLHMWLRNSMISCCACDPLEALEVRAQVQCQLCAKVVCERCATVTN